MQPGDCIGDHVYIVQVEGRTDGFYVFASWEDAKRFQAAVEAGGGSADVWEEPVNNSHGTDRLVAAEDDESKEEASP